MTHLPLIDRDGNETYPVNGDHAIKEALTQYDMDVYTKLCNIYLGGPDIPFEIQLQAFEESGEPPYGIKLSKSTNLSVVDFLRLIIPLRDRKARFGVAKGVDDPEALLGIKQQAVVIYTRCALECAESEVMGETHTRMVYFPMSEGGTIGRKGYIKLFPTYPDSPVGLFRGDGAAYPALECIEFIGKHFPDVEDEILAAFAET